MNYRDYTSRMCPTCHGLRCSPDCPENDAPEDNPADDEWNPTEEEWPDDDDDK